MTNNTASLLSVSTAARKGNGDFYATVRSTARFCTAALVDAAESCVAGMTKDQRSRYVSGHPTYGTVTRDRAVMTLCGWVSHQKVIAFGATLEAALTEFPAALAELGAVL